MDNEIWKPIKGYEGLYEVSNYGRVRNVPRVIKKELRVMTIKPRMISQYISKIGYPAVTLCKNKQSRCNFIHRIIAEAFIPNPENKPCIDHINAIKTDNRLKNLRWVTRKENSNNPITLKRLIESSKRPERIKKMLETKRKNNSYSAPRYVYQFNKDGEFIAKYDSASDASRNTGIHASIIRGCCMRYWNSAGGFVWSYTKEGDNRYVKPRRYNQKTVLQYSLTGELIKEWESLHAASAAYNWFPANLSQSIYKRRERGGFIWKFKG